MISKPLDTQNEKFSLYITIKCKGDRIFRCIASDYGKKNSKYADRTIKVKGERTIYFSFPITPKAMVLNICDIQNRNNMDYEVILEKKPLKEYAIWMDEDTRGFLPLCLYHAQVAGFAAADPMGRKFHTEDNKFCIKYYPVIKDFISGRMLNTPARIGHTSGIIDNSQQKFVGYTFPMRVAINVHEFKHKYGNPKEGLPISDEQGADTGMMYVYLGMGFSKIDLIYVFANVFLKAQTPQNIERMRNIMSYIQRFENQEFAKLI